MIKITYKRKLEKVVRVSRQFSYLFGITYLACKALFSHVSSLIYDKENR